MSAKRDSGLEKVVAHGDVVELTLGEELRDDSVWGRHRDEVTVLLMEMAHPAFVINMRNIQMVTSNGLGVLVSILKRLTAIGAEFALVEVPEPIMGVLRMVKLHRVIDVHGTVDDFRSEMLGGEAPSPSPPTAASAPPVTPEGSGEA